MPFLFIRYCAYKKRQSIERRPVVCGWDHRVSFVSSCNQAISLIENLARTRSMSAMGIFRQLSQRPSSSLIEQINNSGQPFQSQTGSSESETPYNRQCSRDRRMRVEDEQR
jgi:hypothetical protein